MIVVLDTNVIISAFLSSRGAPAEIIRRWENGEFEVVTSPPLITEFKRALTYPQVRKYLHYSDQEVIDILNRFRAVATVIEPTINLNVIERDPDDNRVLECAVTGNASYIVSGDDHLLTLAEYQNIVILNPVGFLATLKLNK